MLPTTSNFCDGAVVPIPTLPLFKTESFVLSCIERLKTGEPLEPPVSTFKFKCLEPLWPDSWWDTLVSVSVNVIIGSLREICKDVDGDEVPIPTLSLPPSTNNILALPLLSTLKSTPTLASLNTVSVLPNVKELFKNPLLKVTNSNAPSSVLLVTSFIIPFIAAYCVLAPALSFPIKSSWPIKSLSAGEPLSLRIDNIGAEFASASVETNDKAFELSALVIVRLVKPV